MLKVYAEKQLAGSLFKPESDPNKYHFGYDEQCPPQSAVSLSMPVGNEHYTSDYKAPHPIFDMNLPEGALADRLRKVVCGPPCTPSWRFQISSYPKAAGFWCLNALT